MFSFNGLFEPVRPFNTQYRCYSVCMLPGNERKDVERGGKIIMPPSSLDHLARLNIVYPMLFKLTNKKTNRVTHCGVLEFVADEGKVYLPYWMMRNLLLEEGGILHIENATLPVATYSKFQPQTEDFLDITNPKAVLENALRNFACLTTSDLIAIDYNDKIYEFCVLETKPGKAVSIIECDMNVEFAPPVGYVEPESKMQTQEDENQPPLQDPNIPIPDGSFFAFQGKGVRLDGKQKKGSELPDKILNVPPPRRGIPDYDYEIGTLRFIRTTRPDDITNDKTPEDNFEAFTESLLIHKNRQLGQKNWYLPVSWDLFKAWRQSPSFVINASASHLFDPGVYLCLLHLVYTNKMNLRHYDVVHLSVLKS